MKASAVSTITKSLPIGFPTLVNYSLLATLGYINLFKLKIVWVCFEKDFMIFLKNFLLLFPKNDLITFFLNKKKTNNCTSKHYTQSQGSNLYPNVYKT
ncbi:hypothetical protein [Flavobacterium lindanitolerans]|uniref:hypothetical protein n=1 Tax=Flavobacterium lindanitolerans TaxID=428988 RepID=UPI002356F869|nr:hypothetical protein [Flavobacterium lindanitolerans]